jgi:hypothetical protein
MNRRALLIGSGAALAGLSIPGWAQVFGPAAAAQSTTKRATILRAALDAARRRRRPLLVLVGDPVKGSDAAQRWTYFLDRGTPRELADLALCDLVCSVRGDLVREFPAELAALPAEVMAILIETEKPELALVLSSGSVPANRTVESDARTLVPHNAAVQRTLHARIAPDSDTLKRRAASARKALSPEELAELDASPGADARSLATIARLAPAQLSLRAIDEPKNESKYVEALGNAVILRWRVGRPPGARWAQRGGPCGGADKLEGSPPSKADRVSGPCGTGFFGPEYSQRFLWFYAEQERLAFEDAPKR